MKKELLQKTLLCMSYYVKGKTLMEHEWGEKTKEQLKKEIENIINWTLNEKENQRSIKTNAGNQGQNTERSELRNAKRNERSNSELEKGEHDNRKHINDRGVLVKARTKEGTTIYARGRTTTEAVIDLKKTCRASETWIKSLWIREEFEWKKI